MINVFHLTLAFIRTLKANKVKNKLMKIMLVILIFLASISCTSPNFKSKSELVEFIQDQNNELVNEIIEGDLVTKISLYPKGLIGEESTNEFIYFLWQVSFKNGEYINTQALHPDNYESILRFYNYEITEKCYFKSDQGKIYPIQSIYSRSFGLANSDKILLVFKKSDFLHTSDNFSIHIDASIIGLMQLNYTLNLKLIKKLLNN